MDARTDCKAPSESSHSSKSSKKNSPRPRINTSSIESARKATNTTRASKSSSTSAATKISLEQIDTAQTSPSSKTPTKNSLKSYPTPTSSVSDASDASDDLDTPVPTSVRVGSSNAPNSKISLGIVPDKINITPTDAASTPGGAVDSDRESKPIKTSSKDNKKDTQSGEKSINKKDKKGEKKYDDEVLTPTSKLKLGLNGRTSPKNAKPARPRNSGQTKAKVTQVVINGKKHYYMAGKEGVSPNSVTSVQSNQSNQSNNSHNSHNSGNSSSHNSRHSHNSHNSRNSNNNRKQRGGGDGNNSSNNNSPSDSMNGAVKTNGRMRRSYAQTTRGNNRDGRDGFPNFDSNGMKLGRDGQPRDNRDGRDNRENRDYNGEQKPHASTPRYSPNYQIDRIVKEMEHGDENNARQSGEENNSSHHRHHNHNNHIESDDAGAHDYFPESDDELPEHALFIGDLSRSVDEATLKKHFEKFGEIDAVDIKKDKITHNNLGYGFVKYKNKDDADRARRELHGSELAGRSIRIGVAKKNTNLFVCLVSDAECDLTDNDLRNIFRKFGPIDEKGTFIKQPYSTITINKTQKSRLFKGFAKFRKRTDAEKAKSSLDGKDLDLPNGHHTTKPVRIGWGDANTQRNCVHVQFDSHAAKAKGLQEHDFVNLFNSYGNVAKVSLPRYPDKGLKGYGFIHFEEGDAGEEAAARSITTLSGSKVCDVEIQCNFGKRQNQRHKRFSQKREQMQSMSQLNNMGSMNGMNMNNLNGMNNFFNPRNGMNSGPSYRNGMNSDRSNSQFGGRGLPKLPYHNGYVHNGTHLQHPNGFHPNDGNSGPNPNQFANGMMNGLNALNMNNINNLNNLNMNNFNNMMQMPPMGGMNGMNGMNNMNGMGPMNNLNNMGPVPRNPMMNGMNNGHGMGLDPTNLSMMRELLSRGQNNNNGNNNNNPSVGTGSGPNSVGGNGNNRGMNGMLINDMNAMRNNMNSGNNSQSSPALNGIANGNPIGNGNGNNNNNRNNNNNSSNNAAMDAAIHNAISVLNNQLQLRNQMPLQSITPQMPPSMGGGSMGGSMGSGIPSAPSPPLNGTNNGSSTGFNSLKNTPQRGPNKPNSQINSFPNLPNALKTPNQQQIAAQMNGMNNITNGMNNINNINNINNMNGIGGMDNGNNINNNMNGINNKGGQQNTQGDFRRLLSATSNNFLGVGSPGLPTDFSGLLNPSNNPSPNLSPSLNPMRNTSGQSVQSLTQQISNNRPTNNNNNQNNNNGSNNGNIPQLFTPSQNPLLTAPAMQLGSPFLTRSPSPNLGMNFQNPSPGLGEIRLQNTPKVNSALQNLTSTLSASGQLNNFLNVNNALKPGNHSGGPSPNFGSVFGNGGNSGPPSGSLLGSMNHNNLPPPMALSNGVSPLLGGLGFNGKKGINGATA